MSNLKAFLNPVKVENKEVIVSKRFLGEDGKPVPFLIRPVTQDENAMLIKKFTKTDKKGVETFNRTEYVQALTARAVLDPPLDNAELQKAYGVLGESALLQKMLYVGEYGDLAQAVQEISGLDEDINDLIEEAKN